MCLSQITGCHRLHEAEQRLARWLLMVQDCSQSDVLNLTQEFLGMMLGSRRTTVTTAAGAPRRNASSNTNAVESRSSIGSISNVLLATVTKSPKSFTRAFTVEFRAAATTDGPAEVELLQH